jgi:uncharacterized protein YndB with AHSA1/START domain
MSVAEMIHQRDLTFTRLFDAPCSLVFRMWTEPDHAKNWWGPRDYPATHLQIDARPGGRWCNCLQSVETGRELWQGGVFREVVAPERLVFTFAWDEEGERGIETLVTVTFADKGGKTLMTFHQAPFQSANERDGHHGGWMSTFDRLVEYMSQMNRSVA